MTHKSAFQLNLPDPPSPDRTLIRNVSHIVAIIEINGWSAGLALSANETPEPRHPASQVPHPAS